MKQLLSITTIVTLLVLTVVTPLRAQTFTQAELQQIARTKAKVAKLSVSPNTKVIVNLEGGAEIKGTLSSISANSFAVELPDGQGIQEIPYLQVKEINKKASTGRIIAAVGVAAAAAVGILYGTAFLLSKCSVCIE